MKEKLVGVNGHSVEVELLDKEFVVSIVPEITPPFRTPAAQGINHAFDTAVKLINEKTRSR